MTKKNLTNEGRKIFFILFGVGLAVGLFGAVIRDWILTITGITFLLGLALLAILTEIKPIGWQNLTKAS